MVMPDKRIPEPLEDHFISDQCKIFLARWKTWRGAEVAPRRDDVRMEDLGEALPKMVEVEVVSQSLCPVHFFGSDLVEIAGTDLTGKNFFEATSPQQRPLRVARCLEYGKFPCGSLARVETTLNSGAVMIREILGLPVMPNGETGNVRILNVSVPLDDYKWQTPVQEEHVLPVAIDFHFIDIGAGVPDDLESLQSDTPLTL